MEAGAVYVHAIVACDKYINIPSQMQVKSVSGTILIQPAEKEVLCSDFLMHPCFGDMADEETMDTLLREGGDNHGTS
ncbi:hypothetical protein [Paenibacillus sp. 22594]|uniref:hypothetical protein n=1 Tax=Paenibacillus sp. 22594 TaxID=3453947 RepID=UPI003F830C9F